MLPTPTRPLDEDNDNRALNHRLSALLSQRQPADVSTPLAPGASNPFSTDLLPTHPSDYDDDIRALDHRLSALLSERRSEHISEPQAPHPALSPAAASPGSDASIHHPAQPVIDTGFSNDLLPTHPSDDDDEDIRALERRLEALVAERQAEHDSAPPTHFPTFSPTTASQDTDPIVPHLVVDTDFSADLLPGPNHPFTLAAALASQDTDTTVPHVAMDMDFSADLVPGPNHPFTLATAMRTDDTDRDDTARAWAFAQRELDAHIAAMLAEEAFYKAQQDAKTVVVSNLAADAQEEDVRSVFGAWKRSIVDVKLERDEKKRSKTARVEMTTRKNAVSVVREVFGNVFGLIFEVELAVEEEEKEDEGMRFGDVQLFKLK